MNAYLSTAKRELEQCEADASRVGGILRGLMDDVEENPEFFKAVDLSRVIKATTRATQLSALIGEIVKGVEKYDK